MISIAADYLILEKMTHFPLIKMIKISYFLGEKKLIQQAIVSTRLAKENAFLLFFLIFLIPEVKELIALVIKQAINTENLRR